MDAASLSERFPPKSLHLQLETEASGVWLAAGTVIRDDWVGGLVRRLANEPQK